MLLALSRDFTGIARFPQILKRHGIHVSVFCDPTFHVQASRFVDQRHSCPTEPAAAAEALRAHLADPRHVYDMVIPGDDPFLAALARRAGEPWVESLLPIDLDTYRKLRNQIAKILVPLLQVWLYASRAEGRFVERASVLLLQE